MTIKEKRIVINWMMNQIEAKEMAEQKAMVGEFTLDQCWSACDGIVCYGESNGKQTIDVIADALGVKPVINVLKDYRNVEFLGTVFTQMIKDRTHDEKQAE